MEQADVRMYQIWLLKITHMEVEGLSLVEATSSTDKDGNGVMAYVNETKRYL